MTADPLHAPTVTGPTTGGRTASLARALGRPLMPWQRLVADVVGEKNPATGLPRWPVVVVTVQRQAGKTTLIKSLITERCLFPPESRRVFYFAQNGKYSRDMWLELVTELNAPESPLSGYVATRSSQGSEVAMFPDGSTFCPVPPKDDALHGKQSDLVIIDEAWVHTASAGGLLMNAITPTQQTRPGAQLLIVSTAGTADSGFLREWVDRGRAGDESVAYIEYGIGDAGDPSDIDAVIRAHPAIGYTTEESFIRRQAEVMRDNPAAFARAYANSWTRTLERAIPIGTWTTAAGDVQVDRSRKFVLGLDVAADGSRAAIAAAEAGKGELIDSMPVASLVDRVLDLREKYGTALVVGDASGPAGPALDALALAGVEVHRLTGQEAATATGMTLADLATGDLRYRPHEKLDDAAESAAVRSFGDGGRRWARRQAAGPICELVALSWAHWGDRRRPRTKPRPMLVTT